MKATFLVKSSRSDEVYDVDFIYKNNKLIIRCSCTAGIYGILCKHKIGILKNDESILWNPDDIKLFKKIQPWINNSPFLQLLDELKTLEKEIDNAKKRVKNHKAKIARIMRGE